VAREEAPRVERLDAGEEVVDGSRLVPPAEPLAEGPVAQDVPEGEAGLLEDLPLEGVWTEVDEELRSLAAIRGRARASGSLFCPGASSGWSRSSSAFAQSVSNSPRNFSIVSGSLFSESLTVHSRPSPRAAAERLAGPT
jgi:hypothetical protein